MGVKPRKRAPQNVPRGASGHLKPQRSLWEQKADGDWGVKGAGGAGKTHVVNKDTGKAFEVGRHSRERFEDRLGVGSPSGS